MKNKAWRSKSAISSMRFRRWSGLRTADGRAEILNQCCCEYTGLGVDQAMRPWMAGGDSPERSYAGARVLAQPRWRRGSPLRSKRVCGVTTGSIVASISASFRSPTAPVVSSSGTALHRHRRPRSIRRSARQRQWAFAQIVDGLPAIVALFTPDGRTMFCNRRMLEYLDETMEQVCEASAYDFHPDDRDEVLAPLAASVQSGKPFDRQARLCRVDGVYRWHRHARFPLHNAARRNRTLVRPFTDIDDTKRADPNSPPKNSCSNPSRRASLYLRCSSSCAAWSKVSPRAVTSASC